MTLNIGLLKEALTWIVAGGGAGTLAFFLIDKVPALAKLVPEHRRYASIALTAALSMAAFAGAVALRYTPRPDSTQGWIESLFAVAFVASGLSQLIHGRVYLHNAPRRT